MPDDDVFIALANPRATAPAGNPGGRPPSPPETSPAGSTSAGPAVAEHLQVLRRAGLVRDEPSGRQRHYHLTAEPLADVGDWLHPFERFWRGRLRTLADFLEEDS